MKTPGAPLRSSRADALRWTGTQWHAMDSNALHNNPFHCSTFLLTGMYTIAMDTNPFMARSALVVEDVLTQQDPAFSPGAGDGNPRPRRFPGPAAGRQTTLKTAPCEHPFAAR